MSHPPRIRARSLAPAAAAVLILTLTATAQAAQGDVALEFGAAVKGTVPDKDDQGTGFTSVISGPAGGAHLPEAIDLRPRDGTLTLIAQPGTSTESNTLVNALAVPVDTSAPRVISARISDGTLDNLREPSQQAGVFFGPTQDDYVKLVALAGPEGPIIQLYREVSTSSTVRGTIGSVAIDRREWEDAETLDLRLRIGTTGGVVSAEYAIDGGPMRTITTTNARLPAAYRINWEGRRAFFGRGAKAGIVAFTDLAPPTGVTFDWFRIAACGRNGKPEVVGTSPAAGETGAAVDGAVTIAFSLPNCEAIDPSTATYSTVRLIDTATDTQVPAVVDTSVTGAVVVRPSFGLAEGHRYRIETTAGVRDEARAAAEPFRATFTTAVPTSPPATAELSGRESAGPFDANALATAPLCRVPEESSPRPRTSVRLNARTLRSVQQTAQEALRRITAVEWRLRDGLEARDLCDGSFPARAFTGGITFGPGKPVRTAAPAPRHIVIPKPSAHRAKVRLSVRQLRVNQRIAQAALRKAAALEAKLDGGLTGADLAPGAITPDKLAPGLSVVRVVGDDPRVAPRVTLTGRLRPAPVRLTLRQVRINRRIADAALARADALVARVEAGIPGDSFQDGSIGPSAVVVP